MYQQEAAAKRALLFSYERYYFRNFNNQQDKLMYGAPGSYYWNGKIMMNHSIITFERTQIKYI